MLSSQVTSSKNKILILSKRITTKPTCRKKREAYRGSEFAPRILADHGIPVVMKVRFDLSFTFSYHLLKQIEN